MKEIKGKKENFKKVNILGRIPYSAVKYRKTGDCFW